MAITAQSIEPSSRISAGTVASGTIARYASPNCSSVPRLTWVVSRVMPLYCMNMAMRAGFGAPSKV